MVKRTAQFGSVSSGTMRTEDLIPCFLDHLADFDQERANGLEEEYHGWEQDEETADYLLEALFEALEEFAPPFYYFGSHPGDGADFGFWFCEEAFESACQSGECLKVADLSDLTPDALADDDLDTVAIVSDRGNLTLYSASELRDNPSDPQPLLEIV